MSDVVARGMLVERAAWESGLGGDAIELKRQVLTAEMLAARSDKLIRTPIEVRFDPLTGRSSGVLPERGLMLGPTGQRRVRVPPGAYSSDSGSGGTALSAPAASSTFIATR